MSRRIAHQPAFVLHRRPWSESSFVVELLTRDFGRVGVLAKGARRLKSPFRGLLEPFQELQVGWSGKGELPVLTLAEFKSRQRPLESTVLFSGFYLNEILMRLLARRDPLESLYESYQMTMSQLRNSNVRTDTTLRCFELQLLGHLGYGLQLDREAESQADILPSLVYDYVPNHGPVVSQQRSTVHSPLSPGINDTASQYAAVEQYATGMQGGGVSRAAIVAVCGQTLLSMQAEDFSDPQVLAESKRLLREQFRQLMEGKKLVSRQLLHGVRERLARASC